MNAFERSLPMMLYRTLDAVLPVFRAIFADFDLTEPQWRVLRVLWEQDGRPVVELGRITAVGAPGMVGVLDRMQKADLLERRPGVEDRRHVRVYLRPRGRALEKSVRPLVEAAYARLQRVLTAAEWKALHSALDKLSEYRPDESKRTARAGRSATRRATKGAGTMRGSTKPAASKPAARRKARS